MQSQAELWQDIKGFKAGDQWVYLDHNATTPLAPSLRGQSFEELAWGNPSSIHWAGREAKAIVRNSRKKIAQLIGASPLELVFTSGGSESNNLAIKGAYFPQAQKGRKRIISSEIEHPSVSQAIKALVEEFAAEVDYVKVDRQGDLDWQHYLDLLGDDVALVSVMFASNETGSLLPIKKMAREAHRHGALFHTDAVQGLGKALLNVEHLGVDLASFSGHKFYGPKGCGFLFSKKGTLLQRQIDGGGQERHRRAGTENLWAIQALGQLAEYRPEIESRVAQVAQLRDRLEQDILKTISGVTLNGAGSHRLGNTLNISISGVDGESLLMNLDIQGFAVSTGAACSAGNPEPSPALRAMGLSLAEAQSSLRISLGWGNSEEQVQRFVEALVKTVKRLREINLQNDDVHGESVL